MTRRLFRRLLVGAFVCAVFAPAPMPAADSWPQWRGPNRDGVAAVSVPEQWPEQLTRVWRVEVGEGHAAPLVADGNVFVFARQAGEEVAACLDLETGALRWQQRNSVAYEMNSAARRHGKGPKSTPVLYQGRLYTLGISGILSCFEAKTGELAWRHDFSTQFSGALPLYGTSMSPLVADGMLIAHVGGHDNGSVMAFDAETGEVKWAWAGDGPAYTSPVVATFDGVRQVVTQTQNACVGIGLESGELLWQLPFTTAWDQNIVTPVLFGDAVVFSGLRKGTSAYRPVRGDDGWTVEQIWHNQDVSMYMSSPVLADGLLFGFAHTRKGHFFCLDARSGERLWQSEGRQADQVAIVRAGNVLLCQKSDAELVVVRESREAFTPVARYSVADSPTWASPAVVDGHVLVKDVSHLTLWRLE